jgi:phosphatidate cytidylyltransferase
VLYGLTFYLGAFKSQSLPVSGGDRLLFLFGLLWVGDTTAMWVGSALGRHKLAPTVSPNKTVEGFVGGILGALAIGVVMIFWRLDAIPWYHVLIIAFGCSIFGQLGDLVESMWKRSLGIKDSSAIIPGHGGVLDRFDSLLFAAPFMLFYWYMLDQRM